MRKFLLMAFLLFGLSAVNAQMMGNATPYNFTPYNFTYSYGYMPGFGMMGQGMMGGYGAGCPYNNMMGGYGYAPYGYGNAPEFGMMNPGMMGMMGGYGYAPAFGTPWSGYGYGSNSLQWIVITILVAIAAYLLGKRK